MLEFLKPTRRKITLAIILTIFMVIAYFVYTVIAGFFGWNLTSLCLPTFIGTNNFPNPSSLWDAWKISFDRCPSPEYYSPLVQFIIKARNDLVIPLLLLFSYILACTRVFLKGKPNKQHKKRQP